MRNTKMRPLLTAAISTAALLAVGAGPASAAWSGTTMKWAGTLAVKKAGGTPVNCTFPATQTSGIFGNDVTLWSAPTNFFLDLACVGGTSFRIAVLDATTGISGGIIRFSIPDETVDTFPSPHGYWRQLYVANVPFTNGAGAVKSKLTFTDTQLGVLAASPFSAITVTGTINVTTSTGGLLTWS